MRKQESAFEKKLSEVKKQLQEKVQQCKVLSVSHCSDSFDEYSFIAFLSVFCFNFGY